MGRIIWFVVLPLMALPLFSMPGNTAPVSRPRMLVCAPVKSASQCEPGMAFTPGNGKEGWCCYTQED
ncbi:MAG: hypothetical protein FD153_1016 [Rhodospirillaceae bacterium]|nr:MAG: hypothetical protein FD153_1016 [Rhodospirillaceae bacterium]